MRLDRVTITGADDSVDPYELIELWCEFPFVEWGILVGSQYGRSRFPSLDWIEDLWSEADLPELQGQYSLHLCGAELDKLLFGKPWFFTDTEEPTRFYSKIFRRCQLNFHGEDVQCDQEAWFQQMQLHAPLEFIFQIDGNQGQSLLEDYLVDHGNCTPLFDCSHGAGVCPGEWPKPFMMYDGDTYCRHGYAGGLGPDNLEHEIHRIAQAAGDCQVWIDMETKVRSNGGKQFDLGKVRECLEIAEPFVERELVG